MKSPLQFTKQERRGIFFLLLIIIVVQGGYFLVKYHVGPIRTTEFKLHEALQQQIDSLKVAQSIGVKKKSRRPYNPNYISDYRGYLLGMTPQEIDRLHDFRKQGKFVNSVAEFQKVTQVSDSLLALMAPDFTFPDWVVSKSKGAVETTITDHSLVADAEIDDLNTVSGQELQKIKGIGEKLSARIVKFRDRLGGFLVNEQLYDVYFLDREVANRILQQYQVLHPPEIKKIDLQRASVEELSTLVYFNEHMARKIIRYRDDRGGIDSLGDLEVLTGFDKEKIARIGLYLLLKKD